MQRQVNLVTDAPPSAEKLPEISLRRRILSAPTLISFAIAIAIVVFMATRVQIDFGSTWQSITRANLLVFLLAFAFYYVNFPLRAIRWMVFVRNAAIQSDPGVRLPSIASAAQMCYLGWFTNAVTGFRLGDVYRSYLFARESGASFPKTLGTLAAEHIVDVIAVFLALVISSVALLGRASPERAPLFIGVGVALLAVTAAVVLGMRFLGPRLAQRLSRPLNSLYMMFHHGTLGSLRQIPWVLLLSLVIWLMEVSHLYLVARALGYDVDPALLFFATAASALLVIVPITPGGLGLVETGLAGLLTLALPPAAALAVVLLDRSITYASVVVIGAVLFVVRHFRQRRASPAPTHS